MDPSSGCVARLQAQGVEALQGWLGDDLAKHGKFDLVILSHVLEHLLDPRNAVKLLQGALAPDGKVYVEVPDAARYLDFPSVPYYYFDSEHINHFDRFSLDNLAKASGYQVECTASKTLTLQGSHAYPAVFALLSMLDAPAPIIPNDAVRMAVDDYVAQSAQAVSLSKALRRALLAGRPIALWGAGSQAQRLLLEKEMRDAHIVAVVDGDRNKHGSRFAGCEVSAPAQGLRNLPANCLVVIAAALVAGQIQAEYHALGLPYECIIN